MNKIKRFLLFAVTGLLAAVALASCGQTGTQATAQANPTSASTSAPRPQSSAVASATSQPDAQATGCTGRPSPSLTEGPYYTPGSPERRSIVEPGTVGFPFTLTGQVLDTNCKPIAGAWLDFWQADGNGAYDNAGYGLRGHQFTDKDGGYRLETVMPGEYPGRTLHIHVKVKAPGGPELTSQLFFHGAAGNASDRIFDTALVVTMTSADSAEFNFVVSAN